MQIAESIAATLPHRQDAEGPVTQRRQRRTLLIYVAFCLAGLLPTLLDTSPGLRAAGLGLWFPGAGFIAVGGWHLLWLPLTLMLFGVALFAWFGSGNVIAPALVWLLSALAAGVLAVGPIHAAVPFVVASLAAAVGWVVARQSHLAQNQARERRRARIETLPRTLEEVEKRAIDRPHHAIRELSEIDLAATRFIFDRALQPVESIEGFAVIEQFQPSALRYQIFDMQYSLGMLQCQYTPNFHGYLSQAQRNLIEKIVRPEIWGYWKWESLWGRFTTDFDPVVKDNIMLTGFYGICLNLYASNTGDHRYAEPGALEFWLNSGQRYRHSSHSIADALVRNFDESEFCLYPCEPNWIYTFCNLQGMTSLSLYDRVYGTHHVDRLRQRFVESWREEFTTLDGSVLPIRSSLTGFTIPGLVGTAGDASGSILAGAMLPDIARRMWAQVRSEATRFDDQGNLHLKLTGADKMDPGNYRKGPGLTYAMVLFAAHEYGDDEVAQAAQRWIDQHCEPVQDGGMLRYRGLSVLANATMVRARIGRRDDWRETIVNGPRPETRRGPLLTLAAYPDVLVALAISDGDGLDLVLYPGKAPGRQRIGIERLQAARGYRIEGGQAPAQLFADAQGRLELDVVLDGRTRVVISPLPR